MIALAVVVYIIYISNTAQYEYNFQGLVKCVEGGTQLVEN